MTCCRHPLACAVPPQILEGIALNGSKLQKKWARRALSQLDHLREVRDEKVERPYLAPVEGGPMRRMVYDSRGAYELPGRLVRAEEDPPCGDPAADEAFELAGITYAFFKTIYGRNSLDDRGLQLESSVHYGESFDNAFWNGVQMVYGDGDEDLPPEERIFNRFTSSIDIVAHELTHGLIQYEANLKYMNQSGALNESIADIMGSLVKQWHLQQKADEADWLIGADLFTPIIGAQGIRSLKEPGTAYDHPVLGGKDPQPGHMRDYVKLSRMQDNGGVHINSGIPSRAFYVTSIEIGGPAWERAGRIWYYAIRDRLRRMDDFEETARRTFLVAGELFGEGSREHVAVRTGWEEVGIDCRK